MISSMSEIQQQIAPILFRYRVQKAGDALINIRPRQNNYVMEILDPSIRERIAQITQDLLGGV